MMSYSFRDKPRSRLSDRLRGKSGDELLQELRQEFDKDRTTFFDSNPNWGYTPAGSAFPRRHMFDDDVDDVLRSRGRGGRTDLRAHLDDLARRHPEFADHLRSPPGWVSDFHTSGGGGGSSSSGHYGASSSGSGGDYFKNGERSNPTSDNENQQHPQQSQDHQPRTQSTAEEQHQRSQPENKQESKLAGNYSSGLPAGVRDTLSQHGCLRNTDPEIGLKGQAAVKEDRNQRSMSAPPDSRTQLNSDKPQRFVSKIEINPVNPATGETASSSNSDNSGKPPMAPPKQQPQQQHQGTPPQHKTSTVRHIPIFVEGRDEPVLPKNIDQDFTVPPSRPAQQFTSQQQFHPQQQPQHHPQPQANQQQQRKPSQHQQQPHQQDSKENVHQQHHHQNQHQQPPPPPPQPSFQPQAEKKQKVNNDPLYQIEMVRDEVDELRKTIDDFKGTTRDKEYIYLDEMLTRNLIKLDIIETDGKENVRAARKDTIKCIQQCINLLESKVPQTPVTQTPSSTNVNEDSGSKMDIDEGAAKAASNGNIKSSDVIGEQCGDKDKQKMKVDQKAEQTGNNVDSNKMIIEDQQQKVSEVQPSLQQNVDVKNQFNQSDQKEKKSNDQKEENNANPNEIKC